ncbi:MAG: M12 family metallopeptidase, partial [Bacteroidales bacterium]
MKNKVRNPAFIGILISLTLYLTYCTDDLPVVTTANISDITETTATAGGNVTDDGGAEVTARGLCWNTSENPTIANGKTSDGKGIGPFTSDLTSLTPDTRYYVKAYATNSIGTSYGKQVSFTTGVILTDAGSAVPEAFPGIDGELMDFIIDGKTITIEKINNKYVFQADILLTKDQLTSGSNKGAGFIPLMHKWNCNTVYYKINNNLAHRINDINAAIQHYESNTHLKFIEWTDPDQKNYVELMWHDTACCSNYGMTGLRQEINLANWGTIGTIIHEIGHTVGLAHEHSRTDRNDYVNVFYNNIKLREKEAKANFDIIWTKYNTSYFDFNSIMLYHSYAFSKGIPNYPTIKKLDGSPFEVNDEALSVGDIEVINLIYPELIVSNACVDITSTVTEIKCKYAKVETLITTNCDLEVTERGVFWGRYQNPELAGTKVKSGRGEGTYSVGFNDLITGVTYFAKGYAITECDTVYGDEVSFTSAPECCDTNPFQSGCNGVLRGTGNLKFNYVDFRNDTLSYFFYIEVDFIVNDGKFSRLPYLDIIASESFNGRTIDYYIEEK